MRLSSIAIIVILYAATGSHAFVSSFAGQKVASAVATSSTMRMAQIPTVNDWKILRGGELMGTVEKHPVLDDGDVIKTSSLENIDGVGEKSIVQTGSGSKYRLGTPSVAQQKANARANRKAEPKLVKKRVSEKANGKVEPASKKTEVKDLTKKLQKAKSEYDLTGKAVGNGTFLLSGRPVRSTSGKSTISACYRSDNDGLPVGESLCVKLSTNLEVLRRESSNYKKVTTGLTRGKFVNFYEFYGRAGDDKNLNKQGAIVMERGLMDCKSYLSENGAPTGKKLRDVCVAAVQCLQAVHSANLVWTDMKVENFVVTSMDPLTVKGIDLESAMPTRKNPVDYSPEACPPEFAKAFLVGDGPYFKLEPSYDVWSLGMALYELSTATTFFSRKSPEQITKVLRDPEFKPDTSQVPDDKLRDLIDSCLQRDPKKRPSITQILLHPYFLTTGFGPFSF